MTSKSHDFTPSLVLAFAVFIAGFLTGMLAIAIIGISSDITFVGAIIFSLGIDIGIIAAIIEITLIKRRRTNDLTTSHEVKN
jgi:nitrate reductase gamma subunit